MLISLHLPKTAGTSFRASLEQYFGERLLEDYADRPLHHSRLSRRGGALRAAVAVAASAAEFDDVGCVHGHFLPLKYRLLARRRSLRFVTWLRDPLERLASHYHYWLRQYDPAQAGPLHRRVVEEQWSLQRFCLSPQLRNCYREFLWGFDPARFDFIGITEHFEADMQRFGRDILGAELQPQARNTNPRAAQTAYLEDETLRRRVAQYHAWDVALYQWALRKR